MPRLMRKKKKATAPVFEHGEAVKYMNPGEAQGLLSPVDRSVLIALDGRMSAEEILDKSGISHVAFVIACQRLVILGLIEEKDKPSTRRS
jgi:hypothetical protein